MLGSGSNFDVTQSLFQYNRGTSGGAFYTTSGGISTINNSTFYLNEATLADGGAFYVQNHQFTFNECTFSQNSAGSDGGAVYYASGTGTIIFNQNTIVENSAVALGGGIYNNASAVQMTLLGSIIAGNSATTGQDLHILSNGMNSGLG